MAFTLDLTLTDNALPTLTVLRLLIGDVNEAKMILDDNILTHLLSKHADDPVQAGPEAMRMAIAKFTRSVNETGAGIRREQQRIVDNMEKQLAYLLDQAASGAQPRALLGNLTAVKAHLEDTTKRGPVYVPSWYDGRDDLY